MYGGQADAAFSAEGLGDDAPFAMVLEMDGSFSVMKLPRISWQVLAVCGKGEEDRCSTLKCFHKIWTLVWGWRAEIGWYVCRVECYKHGVLIFVSFKRCRRVCLCEPVRRTHEHGLGVYFLCCINLRMKNARETEKRGGRGAEHLHMPFLGMTQL